MKPTQTPVGMLLALTAKKVSRAFDEALSNEGGSLPVWLILMNLMRRGPSAQSELAEAVGIQGPTLTHHLNAMENNSLLVRNRMPENRRIHIVALTGSGRAMFNRIRGIAQAHDARLRDGIASADIDQLRQVLQALAANLEKPLRTFAEQGR